MEKLKEMYMLKINKYFKKQKSITLFQEQINRICSYNEINKNNDKCGEQVVIDEKYLIHGTRMTPDELIKVKENGLVAPEFFKESEPNKKKPWVVEFWDVEQQTTLEEYNNKRCGVTIELKNYDGTTKKNIICPISQIEKIITEEKDYRDYIIYQNQEQRFLPNKYHNNNATMAFIINCNTKAKEEIIKNDIFDKKFDRDVLEEILPQWFIEKYIDGEFDHHETGREKAVIVGIPSNLIEGIMVNEEIEKDRQALNKIKEVFNNCYICNIYGKIIM